ncbi:methyltransferase domain-containing protein [bacterium]|nr:methyltransferase domain-containing protein [bacterium]
MNSEQLKEMLRNEEFPLSSKYDPVWVLENEMGPNALLLTEWLCQDMVLKPGMRVLDMGCGKALSSIFLSKEYNVKVFANDLWITATENYERIRKEGLENQVFPIRAEAHTLPYAEGFFDAIISIDSYHYYGTDELYLKYFIRFLKHGGQIGIVVPGLMKDFENGIVPEHLGKKQASGGIFWDPKECFSFHTKDWWCRHFEKTKLVSIEKTDDLEDGWKHWIQFEKARKALGIRTRFPDDIETLMEDGGRYIGLVRLIARRNDV